MTLQSALHKKIVSTASAVALLCVSSGVLRSQEMSLERYQPVVNKIVTTATADSESINRLAELTDRFPGRLSGTSTLTAAIDWATAQLKKDGFDNVHTEKVMVPHWVRGEESAHLLTTYGAQVLYIASLGGSVGTTPEGITAEAVVVKNFAELDALGDQVKGKIVIFNYVFNEDADPIASYRQGTQYRVTGASRAAKYGAVAALVRSVGPIAHRTPHTGAMRYSPGIPQIPAISLSAEDADKLQRLQDRGQKLEINVKLEAKTLADAESANVIAEIKGSELPEEYVVIGGHIDSWDITPGALDDGGGDISTWEALRVLKALHLRPRRTIRLVLFTNEENGGRGGLGYVEQHSAEMNNHVLALETDSGVLPLLGFNFNGTDTARQQLAPVIALLGMMGANHMGDKFDGADITPMMRLGIPVVSPEVDGHKYFYVHHTPADSVDKVDAAELNRVIAAIAALSYVVADMPGRLEHGPTVIPPGTGPR